MNVTDSLLLQQMQNMASLPKTGSTGSKGGKTDSFQDMMTQAGEDQAVDSGKDTGTTANTTDRPAQSEKTEDPAAEDPKTPVQKQDGEKVDETLIDPGAAAVYVMDLFRPEIVEAQPEAAAEAVAEIVEAAPVEEAAVEVPVMETAEAPAQETAAPAAEAVPVETREAAAEEEAPEVVAEAKPVEVKQAADAPREADAGHVEAADDGRQEDVRPAAAADGEEESQSESAGEGAEQANQVFRDVEAAPVKVAESYQTVDTQEPEMDGKLAATILDAAQNGAERVQIQLTPANLGEITIDLTRTASGELQVVIHTSTNKAAGLLNQHLDGLNTALQNYSSGQPVHVEVQRGREGQEQHMFQQADPDGRGQQQRQQQEERRKDEKSGEDFLQKLRLGLTGLEE